MQRLFTVLAIAILVSAAGAQNQSLRQPDVYKVERILTQAMTVHHIPGASVGVVINGVPVWTHGYGMADIEGSVEARDTTEYRLASVSKPLSAVAAMTLVEKHKLDLDAPVQQYCPAFPQKQWPVTVRELLSHTSGVRHYKPEEDIPHGAENTRHFDSINDALSLFAKDPLEFQPGTKFGYSTYGYTVVGCAIEGASGKNFYDYLREAVLSPAGMTHTVPDNLQTIVPDRARGYDFLNGQVINAGLMDSSYKIPGGGLVSNVDDMSNFIVAMLHDRIVSAEDTTLMWTPLKTTEGKEDRYGLGFGVGDQHGWKVIAHTGGQKGTSTILYMIPERQFGLVILTNLEGQGDVLRQAAAAIADELLTSPAQ
jgi:serine beta-lactamase-like protein LACTB, mitochondrial